MATKILKMLVPVCLVLLAVGCATTPASMKDQESTAVPAKVESSVNIDSPVKESEPDIVEKADSPETDFEYAYVYDFAGFKLIAEVHNGYGYVTYPSFITDEEIGEAASLFVQKYGDLGVTFQKESAGKLSVEFPKNLTKKDFDYYAGVVSSELDFYLDLMVNGDNEEKQEAESSSIAKAPEVEKKEPQKVSATPVIENSIVPIVEKLENKLEDKMAAEEQNKSVSVTLIIVIAVILLFTVALCLFFLAKTKKNKSESEE